MITLNDQDVEALLKMSDKELACRCADRAIRLRRDAAHIFPTSRSRESS
jgi:hypothetical protein